MNPENEVVCTARIIPPQHGPSVPALIRTEDGFLPIRLALEEAGFEPGDVVEIRLLRREGALHGRLALPDQFGLPYGSAIPDSARDEHRR